jgi:RNA polymerase-binding transcription factor DksA
MLLTPMQTQHLRDLLHKHYRTTLQDIELRVQQDGGTNAGALRDLAFDEGDRAISDVIAETGHALMERELEELRDLEEALKRLRADTISHCVDCGGDIDFDRLRAYPTAKRCIDCQRRHERFSASPKTSSL